ncbi:MarR family transcriptional regulator [Roseovarius sp. 2305UL8-3]|uniref:MarR family transcriptional regulator n=1 Tax=Roseovarius conchicola TaxID=3121636 RepID=UPI003529AF7B
MRWAVLTGDIVDSSDMSSADLDAVMAALAAIPADVADWTFPNAAVKIHLSRRGGDGWQMAMSRPVFSLRIALFLQANIKANGASTRIAVATGEGHVPDVPDPDLNSAHGPAFQASGRLLEQLDNRTLMAHADGGALDAAFRLADHISQGWTQAQARALCLMLPPGAGPRRVAAKQLGISRQAVDQALNAAGYPALMDAIEAVEAALE